MKLFTTKLEEKNEVQNIELSNLVKEIIFVEN